jgi:predicted DNA-binding transcriptional regulator YafY
MGFSHARLPIQAVPDRLVTRRELADEMRVSVSTVDRLIAAGMPTVRFSPGTVRLWLQQAMMWAAEQHAPTRKAA